MSQTKEVQGRISFSKEGGLQTVEPESNIPRFLVHDETVARKIGEEAGLRMWYALSHEKRDEEYGRDNEKGYCVAGFFDKTFRDGKFMPPLLIFTYLGYKGQGASQYTINLNTGKPTAASPIKKVPRKELIDQLWEKVTVKPFVRSEVRNF